MSHESHGDKRPWWRRHPLVITFIIIALIAPGLTLVGWVAIEYLPVVGPALAVLGTLVMERIRTAHQQVETHLRPVMGGLATYVEKAWVALTGRHSRWWWRRFETMRRQQRQLELPPPGAASRFDQILGRDMECSPITNIIGLHAGTDGAINGLLFRMQAALLAPVEIWERERKSLETQFFHDGTQPWTRVLIATCIARRDRSRGVDLLGRLFTDAEQPSEIRILAVDEMHVWDPGMAALAYEVIADSPEFGARERIMAAERLARTDVNRAASALYRIVTDSSFAVEDRYFAAERTGIYKRETMIEAYWFLTTARSIDLLDRVPATGRLAELGHSAARELLLHGAMNISNPPEVREFCMRLLQRLY
ncbi:hypothetical protein [Glycomyces sp. NRRL B-16210]|uniref:hypothetical protein n=1 Tax=Glycomyces sp. NRRL B-16210 TaxID=1463821 RepID=UPI0004C0D8FF|nr:hypothetical protein [Glycomyces sp. NRRL B-16210]